MSSSDVIHSPLNCLTLFITYTIKIPTTYSILVLDLYPKVYTSATLEAGQTNTGGVRVKQPNTRPGSDTFIIIGEDRVSKNVNNELGIMGVIIIVASEN